MIRIYRGQNGVIDYETVVAEMEETDSQVELEGQDFAASSSWTYVRRRVDSLGNESADSEPCVVTIDAEGDMVILLPNAPIELACRAAVGGGAVITWRYNSAGQEIEPEGFNVYLIDGGVLQLQEQVVFNAAVRQFSLAIEGPLASPIVACVRAYRSITVGEVTTEYEEENTVTADCLATSSGPSGLTGAEAAVRIIT